MSAAREVLAQRARRTWWRDVTFEGVAEPAPRGLAERLVQVESPRSAHLVSSLTVDGSHAPTLDIDFPITVRKLTGGRTRIDFSRLQRMNWSPPPPRKLSDVEREFAALGWIHPDDVNGAKNGVITLRVPVVGIPSSSPGHHHVYVDLELTWDQYRRLLAVLDDAYVLQGDFYRWALERRQTLLFKPGLTKRQLEEERVMLCRGCSSCGGASDRCDMQRSA